MKALLLIAALLAVLVWGLVLHQAAVEGEILRQQDRRAARFQEVLKERLKAQDSAQQPRTEP